VSHTTIHRWVIRYVPEFEKRWNRFARPVNTSWRVDETYINIRGQWNFLYRAVDKYGKTVDFLLRPDRSIAAAQAFFRKALSTCLPRWPRKITLDGLQRSHLALRLLRREDPKWKFVQVRCSQYLNNLIGAPGKVWRFQRVKIPHRQGASHPTGNRALGLWR
jgi:transposase-like protein